MNIDLRDVCKKIEQGSASSDRDSLPPNGTPNGTPNAPPNTLYKKANEPEPDCNDDIDNLYYGISNYPLTGDDGLTHRMYDMGQKNKNAITNRAMWDKNNLIPYLEEELRTHANSVWWDDETLEHEF